MTHGRTGMKHSPDTCAKISRAMIGNRNALGHTPSAAARAKMSAAQMGNANARDNWTKIGAVLAGHPAAATKPTAADIRAAYTKIETVLGGPQKAGPVYVVAAVALRLKVPMTTVVAAIRPHWAFS